MTGWRPVAGAVMLRQQSETLRTIRQHFHSTDCLEVITPVLSRAAVSDVNSHSFATRLAASGPPLYLQTSPEFPMKRLLAAGAGDIYQICPVFRRGEQGTVHNPEFTLLEWYRVGIDHHALMQEVDTLVRKLWPHRQLPPSEYLTYAEAVRRATGAEIRNLDTAAVNSLLLQAGVAVPASLSGDPLDGWLDLLLSSVVAPAFATDRFTLLYDYPATQAALARVIEGQDGQPVAARFELFFGPLELANGYHELQDVSEQRRRFKADLGSRAKSGEPCFPLDQHLLDALAHGLPDCAGVALGIERLMMALHGKSRIDDVLNFPINRA